MGKFYKVDIQGKNWLQRVTGKPVWTADDEGRILFDTNDADAPVQIGGASGWLKSGEHADVPVGTTLLIDSDVAITGYSIKTDQDDKVIYVTKGSAAGGAAGGTNQGTETFPNHAHSQPTHTHGNGTLAMGTTGNTYSLPAHTHPPQSGFANFMSSSGSSHGRAGDSYGVFNNTGSAGSGGSHSHSGGSVSGSTASGGGDNTGNQTAAITWANWKPSGRNFTRQERQ